MTIPKHIPFQSYGNFYYRKFIHINSTAHVTNYTLYLRYPGVNNLYLDLYSKMCSMFVSIIAKKWLHKMYFPKLYSNKNLAYRFLKQHYQSDLHPGKDLRETTTGVRRDDNVTIFVFIASLHIWGNAIHPGYFRIPQVHSQVPENDLSSTWEWREVISCCIIY